MDIMRPKLVRIGDMFFRRLDIPNDGVIDDFEDIIGHKRSEDMIVNKQMDLKIERKANIPSIDVLETMDSDDSIEDMSGSGGRFRSHLNVGHFFHKFIVGQKGRTKERIERSTQTLIQVPSISNLTGKVVITGSNVRDIKDAKKQIQEVVTNARKTCDFTHFVSIPFTHNSIRQQFESFKKQILKDDQKYKGIDESLFQSTHRLHITVVPLLLTDQNEKTFAAQILKECLDQHIKPLTSGGRVRVRLEGIDCMNDDPSEVNVLFAKVVDVSHTRCLQSIVDNIFDKFKESQLISGRTHETEDRKVKLHVTLMNTKFRQKEIRDHNQRSGRPRDVFNATEILKTFGDYCFGEIDIDSIETSIRFSKANNGYYCHTFRIDV